jgi:hypothetical protein
MSKAKRQQELFRAPEMVALAEALQVINWASSSFLLPRNGRREKEKETTAVVVVVHT